MVEILRKGHAKKHGRRGRPPKLSIEDLLLATLEYLREYRTYAQIAASYGIAESNVYRWIKWVEETLIRDGSFALPGRKALLKSDMEYEVILVDATESPIERPKKAKTVLFQEAKAAYIENTAVGEPQGRGNYLPGLREWEETRFQIVQRISCPRPDGNLAGSGYRLPGACEAAHQVRTAEKAFEEASADRAGTQREP